MGKNSIRGIQDSKGNEIEFEINPEGKVVIPMTHYKVISAMDKNPSIVPLNFYGTVLIPAEANSNTYEITTLPDDDSWWIAYGTGSSSANCSIEDIKADGISIGGLYASAGSNYTETNYKQRYGDFIKCTNRIEVVSTNGGASSEDITIALIGFKLPL